LDTQFDWNASDGAIRISNYEVLYVTDPIDEYFVQQLTECDGEYGDGLNFWTGGKTKASKMQEEVESIKVYPYMVAITKRLPAHEGGVPEV